MKNILFAIIFAFVLQYSNADEPAKNSSIPVAAPGAPGAAGAPASLVPPPGSTYSYINKSKVICNYNGRLPSNRNDKYSLVDVDATLCSHVVYNSASLDPATLTINLDSIGPDFENLLTLRQKGVLVILSLGGSFDPQSSEKFSRMVNDGATRSRFVVNTVTLMRHRKIDGLDISWDFPTCWDGYCSKGHGRMADKGNFINLLRDLKAAFRYHRFQLMVSVSPLDAVAEKAYDVPGIARNVDFINLLTYDLNNQSYTLTAIHSAFQGNPPSTVHTVEYWRSKGAPAEKLIVGVPTFGRTFSLAKESWNSIGAPATIGKTTGINAPGMAAYFEVCTGLDYQFVENIGSFAYKGDQWVSFDDKAAIKLKGDYIRKNNLAGALITSLDTDDYSGTLCAQDKYPLIRTMRAALGL